jgi:hypothetical protein
MTKARTAVYVIEYVRPGEKSAMHELAAESEAAARVRFLNLSWVAFTGIVIKSIGIKADQPEAAKVAARERKGLGVAPHAFSASSTVVLCSQCGQRYNHRVHSGREPILSSGEPDPAATAVVVRQRAAGLSVVDAAPVEAASVVTAPPGYDWRAECERLTTEIAELADKAQALVREGRHEEAAVLRAQARTRAEVRETITKHNKRRKPT